MASWVQEWGCATRGLPFWCAFADVRDIAALRPVGPRKRPSDHAEACSPRMNRTTYPARARRTLAGGALAAFVIAGCTGQYSSDFPVVVVNKTANTIQTLANGDDIGQVASGPSSRKTRLPGLRLSRERRP